MIMDIQINRESKTPVHLQIMNSIKNAIIKNELGNGYKLPTERKLSESLGVHRNTVIKAYRLLVDERYVIVSKKPKGYFVSYGSVLGNNRKQFLSYHFQPFEYIVRDEFLHMNALFSRLFHTSIEKKLISFATAMPAIETYPINELNKIIGDLIKENGIDIYGYSNPQGLFSLRKNLSRILQKNGINASAYEITVCSETYQALDYLIKLVVIYGDTIIAEEPINPDMFDQLTLLGASVITIPIDEHGMVVECLENLILKYRPKFILTIPTFQNPSMTVMSFERRRSLLEISYRYNVPIIEINHDSALRYEGSFIPSLKEMDTVIYIDSFIFKIAPGIKLTYIVSTKNIAKKLSKMVEINQIFVNTLSQYIISRFIEEGFYEKHLLNITEYYRKKRETTVECLKKYCSEFLSFDIPEGGSSIWCKLKKLVNQDVLLLNAEAKGISFAPGHLFYPYGNEGEEYIRISYGGRTEKEIEEGIKILMEAFKDSIK
jgi:DNA-binding transcriptional MocR family regulator